MLHDGTQQSFLVRECVEGQTVRDLLQELERVPEDPCRHIGREVAKGLAAIHEAGVVHRDLEPEEYRESMLKNVRLNREIVEAWARHGDKAVEEGGVE